MILELPVDNKNEAFAKIIAGLVSGSVLCGSIFLVTYDWKVLYFLMIFFALWVIFLVWMVHKNLIEKVLLVDTTIIVYHKKKKIEIPLKNVKDISVAVNYFLDSRGNMSKRYVLHLSQRYIFGDKLLLKYNKTEKYNFSQDDPVPIKIMKSIIKNEE